AKEGGPRNRAKDTTSKIFERHAAARRVGAGDPARPESSNSGRADVGTGSGRQARGARHYSAIEKGWEDGDVFHAHSLGRGNVVRPRVRDCGRQASRELGAGYARGPEITWERTPLALSV